MKLQADFSSDFREIYEIISKNEINEQNQTIKHSVISIFETNWKPSLF